MSGVIPESTEQRFGFGRVLLMPIVPIVIVIVVALAGASTKLDVVLAVFACAVLLLALRVALTPDIVVADGCLSVSGRENRRGRPGGSVDLTRLVQARSVQYWGGLISRRGSALVRNQLLLEDADGGQAMFWAWGWSPKAPLQEVLRKAATASRARMDPMTYWRLGFKNDQGARISPLRRIM